MRDVAVVVVHYRTPEILAECLRLAWLDAPAELVVIDNASGGTATQEVCGRQPGVRLVERASNDGFAAGVNTGFEVTTSPFVLVLNPDAWPRPGALAALVEHLRRTPAAGVAAPRVCFSDGTWQPSAYRRRPGPATFFLELCLPIGWIAQRIPVLDPYRVPPSRWMRGVQVSHVSGAALAIRRVAYEAAGPFDESYFMYLEETEWQERVRRAGFTIELVPDAEVVHLVRGGGTAALAPSPLFLAAVRHDLARRGWPPVVADVVIKAALLGSRLALLAETIVIPRERRTGGARAAAYGALVASTRRRRPVR